MPSGFIDELAWLFVPPPTSLGYGGTDWATYRSGAANKQIGYYPSKGLSLILSPVDWLFTAATAQRLWRGCQSTKPRPVVLRREKAWGALLTGECRHGRGCDLRLVDEGAADRRVLSQRKM